MYYVYILQSKLNSESYTGSSNDLKKRFQEHNDGKVTSTKRYKPWKLIYYEAYQTEKLARIREKRLKYNGNAIRELKKRIGFSNPRQTFKVLKSGVALPSTTLMDNQGRVFEVLDDKKPKNKIPAFRQSGAGFTFIELILYISIVTIMLTAIIPFAWAVIGSGSKSATEQEVYSQARYVSERLKYEIRNAAGIDTANSNFDVNLANNPAQKLRLTEQSPVNTYDINVTSLGIVQGKPGNDSASDLNSTDTKVTDLTFTNYTSSDNKTKHVGFTLTITSNYSGSRQEFKETITLRSSAEARNN
ncbi:MAG: GIY-YIG nuclease family protein [Patescibacteria group bacterium]